MSDPLNIDAIYDQIKAVLESHRMSFTHEDEDSTLPLVDMLCAPGAKDVGTGKEEIIAICDAIYSEVLQPLASLSHPATQAAPGDGQGALPPMPPTADRRLYCDEKPHLGLESDRDWCDVNGLAVQWFIENHAAIRTALAAPSSKQEK